MALREPVDVLDVHHQQPVDGFVRQSLLTVKLSQGCIGLFDGIGPVVIIILANKQVQWGFRVRQYGQIAVPLRADVQRSGIELRTGAQNDGQGFAAAGLAADIEPAGIDGVSAHQVFCQGDGLPRTGLAPVIQLW